MNRLVAFPGFADPGGEGLVGGAGRVGPVLAALRSRPFDRVVLLAFPAACGTARETAAAVAAEHPGLPCETWVCTAAPEDPAALAGEVRARLGGSAGGPAARTWFLANDGPPEARAAMVLAAAGGDGSFGAIAVRASVRGGAAEVATLRDPAPRPAAPGAVREAGAAYAADTRAAAGPGTGPPLGEAVQRLGIVGRSAALAAALGELAAVAPHDVPVLVTGETGSGKDLAARLVHLLSGRPEALFVPVNCGALPATLVESTLFGHTRGAFTGAVADRPGKFVQADGGTLFLDELAELPLDLQPHLLRVLEDGWVEPVGGTARRRVSVRIVAATNRDLAAAVEEGRFREDLYYRLAGATVRLPPLRERREDIALLAEAMLARINRAMRDPKRLTPAAVARLEAYDWPGNVRDLENALLRSVLRCPAVQLDAADLLLASPRRRRDPLARLPDPAPGFSLEAFLSDARRHLVARALDLTGGRQAAAARLLGLSPQALSQFLRRQNRA